MVTKRSIHCAIGWLTVEIKFDCIVRIDFQDQPILFFGEHPLFAAFENQLHAYFNGEVHFQSNFQCRQNWVSTMVFVLKTKI